MAQPSQNPCELIFWCFIRIDDLSDSAHNHW